MNDSQEESRLLLIGDLVLDTGQRQVSRHGEPLPLPRLSYRLLLSLAEAAPNVLTQEDLMRRAWPGRVVSPETVTQRVKLTREALGDDAGNPRYIGVVRGQGYRLLQDVRSLPPQARRLTHHAGREESGSLSESADASASQESGLIRAIFAALSRRRVLQVALMYAALVLMLATTAGLFSLIYPRVVEHRYMDRPLPSGESIADPNSIAVLPFANASGNPQDLYISEGLGDVLRDRLGSVEGMRVAARTSSVIFREPTTDAIAIARRLGVSRLIEGSMQREGEQLRISVRIIDGNSGFQEWTGTFNRSTNNLLSVQQHIAEEVVRHLLPERDEALAASEPASLDATAHELMLLAQHHYQQVREQSIVDTTTLTRAIDLYRQATLADPNSALAQSRLGATLLYLGDVEAAEEPIFRALSLNPGISEVQYTLGLYRWMRYLPGTGEAQERAVELNPYSADALEAYGKWIWHQMLTDQVEPYFTRALEIDPMSVNRYADLGNYYGMSGMRDKARAVASRLSERFMDTNACMIVARIFELTGDIDEAIAWALKARKLGPDNPEASWMVAELYARIDDFEAAYRFEDQRAFNLLYWARRYEEMIALGEELVIEQPNQIQIWYGLAHAYAATGQYEQAVHVLRTQGQPEHALSESRRAHDLEALVTLAGVLNELGDVDRARELAGWLEEKFDLMIRSGGHNAWWPNLYSACTLSMLGQEERALERLEKTADAVGMPWYPVLVDAPCFRKFASEPRYLAVVEAIDGRKRNLRERVPDTVAQFQAAR